MTIKRAEFIGFTVLGPAKRSVAAYKSEGADAWPKGWAVALEGPNLVFEGDGRRIEVPRSRCVIYADAATAKASPEDSTGLVVGSVAYPAKAKR